VNLPEKPKFLIVSLRYIGDVLLSTPLALSIKTHLPQAKVDYLVFKGTEGVLAKNPNVRKIHTTSAGFLGTLKFLRLLKRYDFAIGVNPSDRTAICAGLAGRHSIGFSYFSKQEWWKPRILSNCRNYAHDKHIVPLMLSQLEPLGIPAIRRVNAGFDASDSAFAREQLGENYILLHPYTRQNYKYWPAEHWAKLAELIVAENLWRPFFTRTYFPSYVAQLASISAASSQKIQTFSGGFSFPQLAAAIRASRGFVGVDTVATHMAAALDVPVVAIFGPTLVHNWGPWPNDWADANPYERKGKIQTRGNITVAQQNWDCVPCGQQTCPISKREKIECLEMLAPEIVFAELKKHLATKSAL
jgi:heptosyltransferase-3